MNMALLHTKVVNANLGCDKEIWHRIAMGWGAFSEHSKAVNSLCYRKESYTTKVHPKW